MIAGLQQEGSLPNGRHTTATMLLKAGQPIHVVAERLGHMRIEVTLRSYAHVLLDMQQDAARRLGALLYGLEGLVDNRWTTGGRERSNSRLFCCFSRLVRKGGLEPPRSCERQPLKLVRLPIPPLPQAGCEDARSARE